MCRIYAGAFSLRWACLRFIGLERTSALPASTKRVWMKCGAMLPERFSAFSIFSPAETFARSPSSLLGVTPYITASIILQLMTVVSPQLKKLQEEGEMGRQKINQWTRYLTVLLAAIQTSFVAHWLQVNGVGAPGWGFLLSTVLTLTTGTMFVMWLGEQITERGVGNGISLLIFAGIVIGLPNGVTAGVRPCSWRRHDGDDRRDRACWWRWSRLSRSSCLLRQRGERFLSAMPSVTLAARSLVVSKRRCR